ncbi:unnamed protein product [Closterium sp. Yama58-4]|nr:unnamed protein product [Closterium sp. Yama58-4]
MDVASIMASHVVSATPSPANVVLQASSHEAAAPPVATFLSAPASEAMTNAEALTMQAMDRSVSINALPPMSLDRTQVGSQLLTSSASSSSLLPPSSPSVPLLRRVSMENLFQQDAVVTAPPLTPRPPLEPLDIPAKDAQRLARGLRAEVVLEAEEILRGNDRGGYTIPAKGLYPYQWNWDSGLVAIGWSAVDHERAWEEMRRLFSAQWADGMVPHIVFHQPSPTYFPGPEIWGTAESPRNSTGITQPPIAATAVRQLLERSMGGDVADGVAWNGGSLADDRSSYSLQQAEELFPKLMAYHRWFHMARDPQDTGLVATLHPWESGMDNSVAWDVPLRNVPVDDIPAYTRRDLGHVDASMRPTQAEYDRYLTLLYRFRAVEYDPHQLYYLSPFRVTDVCTNSLLHRANLDLRWLAVTLGRSDDAMEIDQWLQRSAAAFPSLWDESSGIFRCRDQLTGEFLDAATSAGFLPLFARAATPEQAEALAGTLSTWLDQVEYGVPSLDPADARFDQLRYWRGPVWAIVNYMVTDGLRFYGYEDLAMRVEASTRRLMNEHGLYEYYDPITGQGAGGSHFSWTAAMALAWLNQTDGSAMAG